ncbi:substrate-binding domain-containing protein [Streptococcus thoraltensis]|uniref:substrate-binding domain-containing protein n=1 Tax=Streptococcus thoraltensis TaxID=55085 RepID=UPI001F55F254|nr:substrate-binding domain-containing protein [Streptococcus thoraltensis]MDY4761755.1 substrate-binding domain-containing protein [Streptococcus thoraltensis]
MRSIRKILGLLVALILLVLVVVMYLNQKISATDNSRLKVGTTYMTMNNPFYEVINAEIEKEITEQGGTVFTRDPALSSKKQVEQIQYFIDQEMDVIILNPVKSDDVATKRMVQKAEKSGIKVIVVDSQLSDKVAVTSTIVSDNYQAGALLAEDLKTRKDKADILMLEHRDAVSGNQRIKGFTDNIASDKRFRIVSKEESLGQTEVAMPVVERVLQSGKSFDVVMALNDLAAIGAVAALDKNDIEKPILIYGVDGSPDMKNLLATTDDVTATVAQSPLAMGHKAAQLALMISKGKTVASKVVIPVTLITKKSIDDYDLKGWQ